MQHAKHLLRQRFLVGPDCLKRTLQSGPPRFRFLRLILPSDTPTQSLQVAYCSLHSGDILVSKSACFNFAGRLIGDEVLTERGKFLKQLAASPKKSHVGSKNLV